MNSRPQEPQWNARLLGVPKLMYNSEEILPLRTHKAKVLLFFLLVEWSFYERFEHRREFLADLLWPTFSRRSALENLRQSLHILRKRLDSFSPSSLFTSNRFTVSKASEVQLLTDLELLKQGHTYDLLKLPVIEHIPLEGMVLYDSDPFQAWLDSLYAEVQSKSQHVYIQAIERESIRQRWEVVEQLAQVYLKQDIDFPQGMYQKLARACIRQGKEMAARDWLEKAGMNLAQRQHWIEQFSNLAQDFTRKAPQVIRMAVLPFQDFTKAEAGTFSIGLLEDLVHNLSQYSSFELASSHSVLRYQPPFISLPEIAFELNVGYLLLGSLFEKGEGFTVNLQLVEGQKDRVLWSVSLNSPNRDLFSLQQVVIEQVLDGMPSDLGWQEIPQKTFIPDPAAYNLFLQAWTLYLNATPGTTSAAIRLFEKAVAIDPPFHKAYLGMALAIASSASWWGDRKFIEISTQVESLIAKAAEDKSLTNDIFCLKGWNSMWSWDLPGAEQYFRLASKAKGNVAFLGMGLAHALNMQGRHEEALQVAQQAVVKDPGHIQNVITLAECKLLMGQFLECEQICRSVLATQPDYHAGLSIHLWALRCLNRQEEAIELAEESLARSGRRTYFILGRLAQAYIDIGNRSAAETLLEEMIQRTHKGEKGFPYFIALYYQQVGESEKALDWLETYQKDQFTDYLWLKVQPEFHPLHLNKRFQQLLHVVFGPK